MAKESTPMRFAYFRKEIVPLDEAKISIASHSLQYGTTCFGGIRGFYRDGEARLFRLYDHFIRLQQSTVILSMGLKLSWEAFQEAIKELIKKNAPKQDFYIRPFIFSENQVLGPRFDGLDFDLAIYMTPLTYYYDPGHRMRLTISSWRKIADIAMPTKAKAGGCYVNSALAKSDAIRSGYDEALMMDEQGNIVEASVANIFIVHFGEIITPEVGASLLEGITRRTVIELLEEEGISVRQERIDRSMIYTAEELILTGTAVQVMNAHSVDGRVFGDGKEGKIAELLQKKLQDVIALKHPKSSLWITVL